MGGGWGRLLMQTQLFPPEIIEHTTEAYLPKVSVRSQLIYASVIVALIGTLVALPFVYVDVSVQSNGIVRTVAEKSELKSLVSGTVETVNVKENQTVRQGAVLFTLTTAVSDSKIRLNESLRSEKGRFVRDLELLTKNAFAAANTDSLQSPLYLQQYNEFRLLLMDKSNQLDKARIDKNRFEHLYKEKVIAPVEMEEKLFAYRKAAAEHKALIENHQTRWQSDLQRYKLELAELEAEAKQLTQEKQLYAIKAPTSGTVQQLVGKYPGGFVHAGEVLGVVSPDANLLAECYVSPTDIGLVKKGMDVRFQIDAFNYNEWGFVKGKVTDVSKDFSLANNQPVFKVKCRLEKQHLQLKNGYTARLKKGMTLRARFLVARRSLFQLLYDTADDWLNPATNG